MKTLVIHPKDQTTEFLDIIYKDKGYTVIREWDMFIGDVTKLVREHDRIMFMGHGGPNGLFGYTRHLNDKHFVEILKTKECVCIWCNADKYVERVGLVGFYTGMFISEVGEARYFGIRKTQKEIDYSNNLFVTKFREVMDHPTVLREIKEQYSGDCEVIKFNNARLYHRTSWDQKLLEDEKKLGLSFNFF